MPLEVAPANASRVLALFPTARIVGRVALDGFGPIPRSFTGFRLQGALDPERRLAEIVYRSAHRFRPAVVVVGSRESVRADRLVVATTRAAAKLGLPVVCLPVERAETDLLGRHPPPGYDKLAQVVAAFLPELAHHALPGSARQRLVSLRRRRSPQWKAAGIAIALLISERPLSAAALLRGKLPPESPIPALLARSVNRLHPAI